MVVFLLQGYLTSGREVWDVEHKLSIHPAVMAVSWLCLGSMLLHVQALLRTLCFSGAVAGAETIVTALYIFPAHIPLFLYG